MEMFDAGGVEVIRNPEAAEVALHATRRALLAALAQPDSAAGLARRLNVPRQRLNYHLRELERCGLVECIEERRKGNCTERVLRTTARAFVISPDALGALGATPEAARDRLSAAYLVALSARTIREVSALETRARSANKRLSTLALDAEVRFESASARAAFAQELSDCVARLTAKYHDEQSPGGRRFRLVAVAHPTDDHNADGSEGPASSRRAR
ncbi:MAG TPA: helix-turn-helix domain-containing protein [Vicinamibacterales bacterium]|nr:helix-turn-helix domain-containing protein [Vicinamibacterales bacterium]